MAIRSKKSPKKKTKIKKLRRKTSKKTEVIKAKAQEYVRGDDQDPDAPPHITNETVAKHRREVLSGARRFVYPLQHSKHRIAIISSVLVALVILLFVGFSWNLLYRQQSTGDWAYRISQIIPFPVSKVDGQWIRYEEYLFELRQNVHYLVNQENVDLSTEEGQVQLNGLRQQALDRVKDNVIIRKLADENNIEVTDVDIDEQIELIRNQGGAGESIETLEDTLADFYGWTVDDLRRVVKLQILKQRLIPILDTETRPRAEAVLQQLRDGGDFAELAAEHSDDPFTREQGGAFGFVFRSNTEIPIIITETGFSLGENEISDIVETTFGLHIVQNQGFRGEDEAKLAHILFGYKDINEFIAQRRSELEIVDYVDISDETLEVEGSQEKQ
ncbi:MAG: peptidylprolyl isomerase [Candidatus Saccharimonadales bacterium]|nr:peptidylprolyl isomerase [Candidatus Saccharimonadales bacterium]